MKIYFTLRSMELLSEGRWTFRQTAESFNSPICDPFWLAPLWFIWPPSPSSLAPSPSRLSRSRADPIIVVWSRSRAGAPGSLVTSSLSWSSRFRLLRVLLLSLFLTLFPCVSVWPRMTSLSGLLGPSSRSLSLVTMAPPAPIMCLWSWAREGGAPTWTG